MGQGLNWSAIAAGFKGIFHPRLYIPQCAAPDIRWIDFAALKEAGYQAICFDKDNTLTLPYENTIHEPLVNALQECKQHFGASNVAVISNSAGSSDDVDGRLAESLESSLHLPVIRHRWKKPLCATEVTQHFNVLPVQIVLIGDRLATDVYMANDHGMLSIHTRPLSTKGDNSNAIRIRNFENGLIRWFKLGPSRPDLQFRFIRPPTNL